MQSHAKHHHTSHGVHLQTALILIYCEQVLVSIEQICAEGISAETKEKKYSYTGA